MGIGAALIGGGANIIGGLIGSKGQSDANQANARQAALNRAFQERMSNTAYQRAAQDLDKAGLNRILALGSPASTPGGAQARMENTKKQLGESVSSAGIVAAQVAKMRAETKQIESTTRLRDAQRQALGPAAAGGAIGEAAIDTASSGARATAKGIKGAYDQRFGTPPKLTPSIQKRHNDSRIGNIATSFGMSENLMKQRVETAAAEMDLPRNWTKEEKIGWLLDNPERLRQYIERRYGR